MMIPTSRSDRNRLESSGKITLSDRFLTVLSDLGIIYKRFIVIN
jgi:hypothetical protein